MNIGEQPFAAILIGHKTRQPQRHFIQPALAFGSTGKYQPRRVDIIHRLAHHRSHVVRQGFFTLRPGHSPRRHQRQGRSRQQLAAF